MYNSTKDIITKYKDAYYLYVHKFSTAIDNNFTTVRSIISSFMMCFITFSYSQNNSSDQSKEKSLIGASLKEITHEKESDIHASFLELKESSSISLGHSLEKNTLTEAEKDNSSSAKIFVAANTNLSWDKNQMYTPFTVVHSKKKFQKNNFYQGDKKIQKGKHSLKFTKNKKANARAQGIIQANLKKISSQNSPLLIAGNHGFLLVAVITDFQHLSSSKSIKNIIAVKKNISKWLICSYIQKLQKFIYYRKKINNCLVTHQLHSRPPPLSGML